MQNASTYTLQMSRVGIPTNLSASFTVSSSGGSSGVTVTAGPNWPVQRNATNSSILENLNLTCTAGYALSSVTNNSVCTQFETPASAAATYYPLSNPAGYTSNTGTVTSVSLTTNGSTAIVITGSPVTTSSTINIQVQNATTTQDGLMTATQATSLSLKALAGNCVGSNSTHVNVTMNATTAGVQCIPVALNPGGGGSSLTGGLVGLPAVWSSASAIIAQGINASMINTSNTGADGYCIAFGSGTQLKWIPCSNLTNGLIATLTSETNNSGTSITNLFAPTIPGSTLGNNGDTIQFDLSGYTTGCTTTVSCDLSVYINGTKVYDSGAVVLSSDQNWNLWGVIQRKSSTTLTASVRLGSSSAMTWNYNNITKTDLSLNWASTFVINFTAIATGVGAGSNQIVAREGYVQKGGAANGSTTITTGGNTTDEVIRAVNNTAINISGNAFNSYNLGGMPPISYSNQSFNVTCGSGTVPQSFGLNSDGTSNATVCVAYEEKTKFNNTNTLQASTNDTVYSNVQNLTLYLDANKEYVVNCNLRSSAALATTGTQLRVNTTGSPTSVSVSYSSFGSATAMESYSGTNTASNAYADLGSGTVLSSAWIYGMVQTSGSASVWTVELKSEVAGSAARIGPGSMCEAKTK